MAVGDAHSVVLLDDGSVWTWGNNSFGQLGAGDEKARDTAVECIAKNAVKVAAGQYHSLALLADGSLWSWGSNRYGQLCRERHDDVLGNDGDELVPTLVPDTHWRGGRVTDVAASICTTWVLTSTGKSFTFGSLFAGDGGVWGRPKDVCSNDVSCPLNRLPEDDPAWAKSPIDLNTKKISIETLVYWRPRFVAW